MDRTVILCHLKTSGFGKQPIITIIYMLWLCWGSLLYYKRTVSVAVNEKLTEQLFFYVLRLFITRFPLLMRRSRRINHYPANQGNGNGWWEVGFRITGCHPWWAEIGINGSKLECMDESWVALNSKMNGFWTLEVKKPIIRQAVSLSVLGVVDKYRLYQNPISINCGFPTTCHSTTIGHFPLNLFVTLIAHRYCRH